MNHLKIAVFTILITSTMHANIEDRIEQKEIRINTHLNEPQANDAPITRKKRSAKKRAGKMVRNTGHTQKK